MKAIFYGLLLLLAIDSVVGLLFIHFCRRK
jgi:hypothetical protein